MFIPLTLAIYWVWKGAEAYKSSVATGFNGVSKQSSEHVSLFFRPGLYSGSIHFAFVGVLWQVKGRTNDNNDNNKIIRGLSLHGTLGCTCDTEPDSKTIS